MKKIMESKTSNPVNLGQTLTSGLQQLTNLSLGLVTPFMEGVMGNISSVNKTMQEKGLPFKIPVLSFDNCDCPPKQVCPPHCIAGITRCAMSGDRINVPFLVKNTCSQTKTYRVGVRELKSEEDGQLAPTQPVLNKTTVTLDPGRSEMVVMMIDLANFKNGSTYATEIVLREREINQNICFTLKVDDSCDVTVVAPKDEKDYRLRWQSWKDHYYCERPPVLRQVPGTNILSQASEPDR
jgi:hypothetical protein